MFQIAQTELYLNKVVVNGIAVYTIFLPCVVTFKFLNW